MIYKFSDITNEEVYQSSDILFVTGNYNIFNNICSDNLKDRCKPSLNTHITPDLASEFGISTDEEKSNIVNSVNFNEFMSVNSVPSISGKWFCSVDFKMLTKKQKEQLEKYIKSPSHNGVLVIQMTDYADYKFYLRNKLIQNFKNVNLIQLSFPNRKSLIELVIKLFENRGVTINEASASLFVIRMSSNYDDYMDLIDNICTGMYGTSLNYSDMTLALKGVENYVLDDFIEEILKPLGSEKITNRQIYKILNALLRDIGPIKLVHSLKDKVSKYIEYRIAINRGKIPVLVKYSVPEIKSRLVLKDDDSENKTKYNVFDVSDFTFKKMARIASQTSLLDWLYIYMILSQTNVVSANSESYCIKILYTLIHRTALNRSRLDNDISLNNIVYEQRHIIDLIDYDESKLTFKGSN